MERIEKEIEKYTLLNNQKLSDFFDGPKPDFENILDDFKNLLSKSSCAINLMNLKVNDLRIIHQKVNLDDLVLFFINSFKIISNNDYYWDWYIYGNREHDIRNVANDLNLKWHPYFKYKTSIDYGLYFILISFYTINRYYTKKKLQPPITDPFWIMFIISLITPLIGFGGDIRKIISMFSDICKKYDSDIKFEYVCDKRTEDVDYTCGRYLAYDELTKTIEIRQTVSTYDDNVLFSNVEQLKKIIILQHNLQLIVIMIMIIKKWILKK